MSNEELDNFIYNPNKKRNINTVLNNEVWNTLYCSRNIADGFIK
jgi:hypothetical protein